MKLTSSEKDKVADIYFIDRRDHFTFDEAVESVATIKKSAAKQYIRKLLWAIEYTPDDTGIEFQYLSVVADYLKKELNKLNKKAK